MRNFMFKKALLLGIFLFFVTPSFADFTDGSVVDGSNIYNCRQIGETSLSGDKGLCKMEVSQCKTSFGDQFVWNHRLTDDQISEIANCFDSTPTPNQLRFSSKAELEEYHEDRDRYIFVKKLRDCTDRLQFKLFESDSNRQRFYDRVSRGWTSAFRRDADRHARRFYHRSLLEDFKRGKKLSEDLPRFSSFIRRVQGRERSNPWIDPYIGSIECNSIEDRSSSARGVMRCPTDPNECANDDTSKAGGDYTKTEFVHLSVHGCERNEAVDRGKTVLVSESGKLRCQIPVKNCRVGTTVIARNDESTVTCYLGEAGHPNGRIAYQCPVNPDNCANDHRYTSRVESNGNLEYVRYADHEVEVEWVSNFQRTSSSNNETESTNRQRDESSRGIN